MNRCATPRVLFGPPTPTIRLLQSHITKTDTHGRSRSPGGEGINPGIHPQSDDRRASNCDSGHMTITNYLLNIGLISLVILQIRGHYVTRARLLFPLVATIVVAGQFLRAVPSAGNDLILIVGLCAIGAALGVGAALVTTVRLDGSSAFAKAGLLASVLWVVGIGARMGFAFWVSHGGQPSVARFSLEHHITSGAAWGAAFVLMAMAEVVARTGVVFLKARRTGAVIERGGLLRSRLAA
jgi:hypothetical protein